MRVLVTGGAGFIGSHLTDALLARGDEVAVVDDLSSGRTSRLDGRVSLHKVSVTDARALGAAVQAERPELICHLAAQIDVRASVASPADDAMTNVVGTVNVLEAARSAGVRVLFCSTGGALYGRDAPIPSMEDVLPLPESPYGVAKYCAEQYVGLYNRLHETQHSVLRLANFYGPRQDPGGEAGVVPIFCARVLAGEQPVIYGDGTQTRDYVYVGDAVSAFSPPPTGTVLAPGTSAPGWRSACSSSPGSSARSPAGSCGPGSPPRARVSCSAARSPSRPPGATRLVGSHHAGRRHPRGLPVDRVRRAGSRASLSCRTGPACRAGRLAGHGPTGRAQPRSAARGKDHQELAGPRGGLGAGRVRRDPGALRGQRGRGAAALAAGERPGLGHRRVRDAAAGHQYPQRPGVCQGQAGRPDHGDLPAGRPVAAGVR